jgi:hypothetical protein
MAQLNPARGEINGLIDGWRSHTIKSVKAKAHRYNRRVADALVLGLEHDIAGAAALLAEIKKEIVDERISSARLLYLLVASFAVVAVIAIVGLILVINKYAEVFPETSWPLWFAAAAGAVGAFFSIAIGLRGRTVLMDLRSRDNAIDAVLRVVIGFIAATVLVCFVQSKAINFRIGDANWDITAAGASWLIVLIVGFVGGFSERMVPDLLGKVTAEPPESQAPSPAAKAVGTPTAQAASVMASAAEATAGNDGSDHETGEDNCLSDAAVSPSEATPDTELPPASGGVAVSRQGTNT